MIPSILKAKYVWMHPAPIFGIAVSVGPYFLGIHFNDWGIRLMVIWWHLCWSYPTKEAA